MTTVYKYLIVPNDIIELELPAGAKLLKVAEQRDRVHLWALVDTAAPPERRKFLLTGTGTIISVPAEQLQHVDTWLMQEGRLVFHLFEIKG
jgi:hypothetical protein